MFGWSRGFLLKKIEINPPLTSINNDWIYIMKNFEHKFSVHWLAEWSESFPQNLRSISDTIIKSINVMASELNNKKRTISNFQFPVSYFISTEKEDNWLFKKFCIVVSHDITRDELVSKIASANTAFKDLWLEHSWLQKMRLWQSDSI